MLMFTKASSLPSISLTSALLLKEMAWMALLLVRHVLTYHGSRDDYQGATDGGVHL